jgi:hypothetical protein
MNFVDKVEDMLLSEAEYQKALGSDNFYRYIEKNCMSYIKDFKKNPRYLYRGIKSDEDYLVYNTNNQRTFSEFKDHIMKYIDKKFYSKFDVEVRKRAIYCTFADYIATMYGNIYIIIPYDNYKIFYSDKIMDITQILSDPDLNDSEMLGEKEKKIIDTLFDKANYKEYTEFNKLPIDVGPKEMMVITRGYLAIKKSVFEEIIKKNFESFVDSYEEQLFDERSSVESDLRWMCAKLGFDLDLDKKKRCFIVYVPHTKNGKEIIIPIECNSVRDFERKVKEELGI